MDAIQRDLEAWQSGNRRAGNRAIDAIAREWRPRVRTFLQAPSEDEVDEVLQEAQVALCVAAPGSQPRVMAPPAAEAPASWRRKVLKNFLVDRSRRRGRRRHAEQGLALDLTPANEAEAWKRDRSLLATQLREGKKRPPAEAPAAEALIELSAQRHAVVRALPELAIRYRVLIALLIHADPLPFAAELAKALHDDEHEVRRRMDRAITTPHDADSELLSLAMVRVIWSVEEEARARESARKNLERAIAALRERLGVKP